MAESCSCWSEHVTLLERYITRLDDDLRLGNLRFARQAAALLDKRRQAVRTIVAKHLEKPFDFDKDESIETDPEKIAWSKDEAALSERWRKMLKLQVLERVGRMEAVEKALADPKNKGADIKAPREKIPATFDGRAEKARTDFGHHLPGAVHALGGYRQHRSGVALPQCDHLRLRPAHDLSRAGDAEELRDRSERVTRGDRRRAECEGSLCVGE